MEKQRSRPTRQRRTEHKSKKRERERGGMEEKKKQKEGMENELFIPDCFCNIKSNLERPRLEAGGGGGGVRDKVGVPFRRRSLVSS